MDTVDSIDALYAVDAVDAMTGVVVISKPFNDRRLPTDKN